MSIQIDFTPDIEIRLKEVASQHGQDASDFVRDIIETTLRRLPNGAHKEDETPSGEEAKRHFYHTAPPEEWKRVFNAIGKGNEHLPVLPPEAFERETLYEDRF